MQTYLKTEKMKSGHYEVTLDDFPQVIPKAEKPWLSTSEVDLYYESMEMTSMQYADILLEDYRMNGMLDEDEHMEPEELLNAIMDDT